nr:DUF6596 domain-containing protein [uncultured Roseateles sp.]
MRLDSPSAVGATAEAVARRSYGRLIAFLAARTHDVAGAEDALSEAFASALASWPANGIPINPEAWLLTAARRRLIDGWRQHRGQEALAQQLLWLGLDEGAEDVPPEIPDQRLALMFACTHPAIDAGVRAPLMLQTILGFDAATIASAVLVAPATMGQRLVRAKARIRQAGIPFQVPGVELLGERLAAVLEAVYATFSQGWDDPTDAGLLADEAIWLGRLLAALLQGKPEEPEALGLLALMLHSHARRHARRDGEGRYVPLSEQDVARWDAPMMDEAETLLGRAGVLGALGRFQIEAAIQSAHAVRRLNGQADWPAIEQLYRALALLTDSPVVGINHAIALAHTQGPAAGLGALDGLLQDPRLADFQPFWAARAELLARSGNSAAAGQAYARAAGLTSDPAVRAFLQQRRSSLETPALSRHPRRGID